MDTILNKGQKEKIKHFFSVTAARYKMKYFRENLDFQTFLFLARREKLISLLAREYPKNGTKAHRCLDIGCGTGDYLIELLDFAKEVVGADYAEGMLTEAKKKIAGQEHCIRLSLEDIEGLSFSDNYFDFVVCAGVLEYLYDDSRAFSEIHRVLKPGGFAYITFPNKLSPFMQIDKLYSLLTRLGGGLLDKLNMFELILGRKRLNALHTIHRAYSTLEVRRKARSSGFKYKRDVFSGYGSFYLCNKVPYCHVLGPVLENLNEFPFIRRCGLNYIVQIEK